MDRSSAASASRQESWTWRARELVEQRERVEEALLSYAESLRFWNAPDDAHTRLQLRAMVEEILVEVMR